MTDQERLDEAEQARHELLTGKSAVSISSSSGKSVSYEKANLAALESYIVGLRQKLGLPSGVSRPIVPLFG
jgi:hypothetical protein